MEFNQINDEHPDENDEFHFESPKIFIERLIKLRHKKMVTDKDIRDQVNFILFAGQDTSSFTIAMTVLMIAMHPKVEQCVVDELNDVFGNETADIEITMEHVNKLIYLEQVIKETLRLHPVAPMISRRCTEDTPLGNFTIPRDTEIVIPAISAHRRKDIWGENADEFNPEHFSKEANSKRNPFSYIAFSNGARDCLGMRESLSVIYSSFILTFLAFFLLCFF